MQRDRLRIAMQKSGRLTDPSQALLAQCGLNFRLSRDRLFCYGETLPVDLLLVRDDDIPSMLAQGVADLGFVGRNVLAEQQLELAAAGQHNVVTELRALGFGSCRLAIALPDNLPYDTPADLAGMRIATSFPRLLAQWLADNAVSASIVLLNGSVEIAPRLGTADAVCDLVSSGATLVANQLHEVAAVLSSEAVLAGASQSIASERADFLELLLRRLDGVLAVKDSRLVMLHAPRSAIEAIARLLPGNARPSVMPLEGSDDVALQAVCLGALDWSHLEEMKRAGAHSLLVLPVEKMLA